MSTLHDKWQECADCGKPLTPEEAHYYEHQCEECVKKDMARGPHIKCGFCRGGQREAK